MAAPSALISFQDGPAAAVNLASGASGVATSGNTITLALQNNTGVANWWVTINADDGSLSGTQYDVGQQGPFTYSFPTTQRPVRLTIVSEVTDGNNNFQTTNVLTVTPGAAPGIASAPHVVRGVVLTNVANLASFTVASGDLTFAQGNRVLLVNQSTASQNGIYTVGVVGGGTAPLTRAADWATGSTLPAETAVMVSEGTQGKGTTWVVTTVAPITVDTTNVTIVCPEGNWVSMLSTSAANQAGPANVFVSACCLIARYTGVFHVDINIGWSDGTTGDTVTWAFLTDTSASGVLAGANKAQHGVNGIGTLVASGTPGAAGGDSETMDGAGNLTYNGAAWNTAPITQASEANPTLTGLLSGSAQKFVFSGFVYNVAPTGTTKTPFTIGNSVGFGVKVSATNTITMPSIRMTVKEVVAG